MTASEIRRRSYKISIKYVIEMSTLRERTNCGQQSIVFGRCLDLSIEPSQDCTPDHVKCGNIRFLFGQNITFKLGSNVKKVKILR